MPTPDGREWLSPRKLGFIIMARFVSTFKGEPWFDGGVDWTLDWDWTTETFTITGGPFPSTSMLGQPGIKQQFIDILVGAYQTIGYNMEFKILRLTERLKDRIADGTFTHIEQVKTAFRDIYTKEVLDQVDEEGNLISSGSGG